MLLKSLESPNLYARYAAAEVLARIRADQAPEFERLKPRLRNRALPADVFGILLTGSDEYGRRRGRDVRCFALTGLVALGPGAKSKLGTVLELAKSKDEEHEIRALALEVVRSVGSPGNEAVALVKRLFQDPEEWPDVRAGALRALAEAGSGEPEVRLLLQQAVLDSKGLVRVAAAEAPWQSGAPVGEILPALTNALGHKLFTVRVAALKAISGMGRTAQPAAPAVRGLLSDEREPVRRAASAALAGMGLEEDHDSKGGGRLSSRALPETSRRRWQPADPAIEVKSTCNAALAGPQ